MTSLKNAVDKIYNEKWTLTTNFSVSLFPTEKSEKLWKACGMPEPNDDINIYLKDFKLPQMGQTSPVEEFIGHRFKMAQGYLDPFTFDLTLKDHDSFKLYRAVTKYILYSKNTYLENFAFTMKITKLGDFQGEKEFDVMTFKNCIITNVSEITLNNDSESQIVEIGVNIKTSTLPEINGKSLEDFNYSKLFGITN